MMEITAPPDLAVDASGRLDVDIECRSCGYNLRGAHVDGECPECTTSVGRSVHGDLLQFSDPAWVDRVAQGARWFVVAILGGILLGICLAVAVGVSIAMTGSVTTPAAVAVGVLMFAIVALQLFAYWLVTTPDPGRDESEQPFTPRAIARYTLLGSTLAGIAGLFVDPTTSSLFGGGAITPAIPTIASVFVAALVSVVSLIAMGAFLVYARTMALRVPDVRLARHLRIVMIGYLVSATLVAGIAAVAGALKAGGATTPMFDLAQGVASLPGAVFGIWGLVLVFWFRRRLRAAAAAARATWAAPSHSE